MSGRRHNGRVEGIHREGRKAVPASLEVTKMTGLNALMAKVLVAIEQIKAAERVIDDLISQIQKMIVTEAEADSITIDDPDG